MDVICLHKSCVAVLSISSFIPSRIISRSNIGFVLIVYDGDGDGIYDGYEVGVNVGDADGVEEVCTVGLEDGVMDGSEESALVGVEDGAFDSS